MNNTKLSISLILFLLLLSGIAYLSVNSNNPAENGQISLIEIEGNNHLPKISYFEYAKLDDKSSYDLLTTNIIRDRFQKHPYIKEVRISNTGNGKIKVELKEKDFRVLLLLDGQQYIVTKDLEILPLLPNS